MLIHAANTDVLKRNTLMKFKTPSALTGRIQAIAENPRKNIRILTNTTLF